MDIQQLKYFLAVSRTHSYTKAAEELFISRQAVAQSVKQLERSLNSSLFEKDRTPLQLTPLGQAFTLEAEKIVSRFTRFEHDMMRYAASQEGNLSIAVGAGIMMHLSPDIITEFNRRFPNILLSTCESNNQEILRQLQDGTVDAGLIGTSLHYLKGVQPTLLIKSDLYIWVNRRNPLSERPWLTFADLKGQPMVGHGEGYDLHRFYVEKCREAGFQPTFSIISSDPTVAIRMVEQNRSLCFGYAGVDQDTAPGHPDMQAVLLPLRTGEEDQWGIYAITRGDEERSLYQKLFIDYLAAYCKEGTRSD